MSRPVIVLDFGAQYGQLIARRVREIGFYSELLPFWTPLADLLAREPRAVILSGGPKSVFSENAPSVPEAFFAAGVPTLGICYGMQVMALRLGGTLTAGETREYGRTPLQVASGSLLLKGSRPTTTVWMSHGDTVTVAPEGFQSIARTQAVPVAAMEDRDRKLFAVQFHPEVAHTDEGMTFLRNFLLEGAGLIPDWSMGDFIAEEVARIREKIGEGRAIVALSGGVDSAVAAALVERAIGPRLTAVFVDHGLMRMGEGAVVEEAFTKTFPVDFHRINAQERFLTALSGVVDPEQKRKIIGKEFIRVFEDTARTIGEISFLVQGTLYPDVIESGFGEAEVIKSHHNVGGLPEDLGFTLVEPLRDLFKDEVRALGRALGLPDAIVQRQPFPGPGLAIRVMGAVTEERLALLRQADRVVTEEVERAGLDKGLWQYFAVLPGALSVGVMGDGRTYQEAVVIRAVTSDDGMTADWARLPHEFLDQVANRLVREVRGVNRVLYDITSKPPGTIEWE